MRKKFLVIFIFFCFVKIWCFHKQFLIAQLRCHTKFGLLAASSDIAQADIYSATVGSPSAVSECETQSAVIGQKNWFIMIYYSLESENGNFSENHSYSTARQY